MLGLHKYSIIYADPPWRFRTWSMDRIAVKGEKWGKADIVPYNVMNTEDICKLPIKYLAAKDCILFIWTTSPTFEDALKVIRAWGFEYKTKAFCWVKMNPSGFGLFTGLGYWTRANTEDCLLATKGNIHRVSADVHQVIMSPVMEHSHKPAITRERIVELMGDLPRIELFARHRVEGWDAWGNEVDSDIDLYEIQEMVL